MSDPAELFTKLRGYIVDIEKINPLKPEDLANLKTVQNKLEAIYDRHGMLQRPVKTLRRISVSTKKSG